MIKISLLLLFLSTAITTNCQITFHKTLYHQHDKVDLTNGSIHDLENLIQQLKNLDVKIVSIRSHADKSGSNSYNNSLSEQRNLFVLSALQKHLPSDIKYVTGYFGEDSLLRLNDSEQQVNRRTDIVITYSNKQDNTQIETQQLVPYKEDVIEQQFKINLNDTVAITAREGTFIKFSPGSFLNEKHEVARGNAILLIKEYYKPGDILLSGMHSLSGEGLLQTGGMFKIFIVQEGDTMLTETQKPVQIKMPDINNLPGNMNVFTSGQSDTSLWKDNRKTFKRIVGTWNWPAEKGKLRDFYTDRNLPFTKWKTGRKWSEEYIVGVPFISWGSGYEYKPNKWEKPFAKKMNYTITKTDTATLTVNIHERFRRRGSRKFKSSEFDTTFLVKYSCAVFETTTSSLNYINCDRFINSPEVTDFYVKTPGFNGAQLLVYFKNLKAFMSVRDEDGMYAVKKVPPGEEVYLIAVGKKGDDFYYGKKAIRISQKATANVPLQKVNHEDMKEMFKVLGYKG